MAHNESAHHHRHDHFHMPSVRKGLDRARNSIRNHPLRTGVEYYLAATVALTGATAVTEHIDTTDTSSTQYELTGQVMPSPTETDIVIDSNPIPERVPTPLIDLSEGVPATVNPTPVDVKPLTPIK